MLGPWIKLNWNGQTGDDKSEHQYFRNQWTQMYCNGEITEMAIISTTVGKNALEEME